MNRSSVWRLGILVAAVFAVASLVGCETTETADSVITVTPASSTLNGTLATATLTASTASTNMALALPLVWTVANPSLGNIRASTGLTAVYESTGRVGNNIVTVRDQGQAEGMATIVQQ